jgi:hypothetical protein
MANANRVAAGALIVMGLVGGAIITLSVDTFAAKTATFALTDDDLDKQSICVTRDRDGNKTVIVSFAMVDAVTGLRYTAGWQKEPKDVIAWSAAEKVTLRDILLEALQEARTETNLQP